MSEEYADVELVGTNHSGYKTFCHRYKNNKVRRRSSNYKVNTFQRDYMKELSKWEHIVQCLLSTLICEEKNRILKYVIINVGLRYREIDFIAKPTDESLILCEIKLKESFIDKIKAKSSGWAQLNLSTSIANYTYRNIGGLAICVDMSNIYYLKSSVSSNGYCRHEDIPSYFSFDPSIKNIIWLDSLKVANFGMKYGLLEENDIKKLRGLFQEKRDPVYFLQRRSRINITTTPKTDPD
jgi:hypothetical protein